LTYSKNLGGTISSCQLSNILSVLNKHPIVKLRKQKNLIPGIVIGFQKRLSVDISIRGINDYPGGIILVWSSSELYMKRGYMY
jgi:hypothetical protein